jgi:isopenicillin-N N-acyltransferase like protein
VTIPVVYVEGDAYSRGAQAGRALAEPIRRSLRFYRDYFGARGLDGSALKSVLVPYREAAEAALPELLREIDGMADGAEVSWWELFAGNAFEELEPMWSQTAAPDRCTAFAVAGTDGTILGHNEQWCAGDMGNVAVIVARPEEGPSFAAPTCVAFLPAVGMNSAGGAQSIMSLTADDDGVGIPRVLVSRHALQASDPQDAQTRATIPGRAGGYAHLWAFADGEIETIETSATAHAIVPGPGGHTNHYLDDGLATRSHEPGGSRGRLRRLLQLLGERPATTTRAPMEILGDHDSEPQSICMHPDPAAGDDADAIVFSMVCHLEEGRMWVADGNPCTARFEEIDLRGTLGA